MESARPGLVTQLVTTLASQAYTTVERASDHQGRTIDWVAYDGGMSNGRAVRHEVFAATGDVLLQRRLREFSDVMIVVVDADLFRTALQAQVDQMLAEWSAIPQTVRPAFVLAIHHDAGVVPRPVEAIVRCPALPEGSVVPTIADGRGTRYLFALAAARGMKVMADREARGDLPCRPPSCHDLLS